MVDPTGVKFRAINPPRMRDEPSVRRPLAAGVSALATPLEAECAFEASMGGNCSSRPALEQGIAMRRQKMADSLYRGDCKYEGAILITARADYIYTIFGTSILPRNC